jgi:hypothetical protein
MPKSYTLEEKEKNLRATLTYYASGDGSLSFTYEDKQGNATADRVTLRDIKWYLIHRKPQLIKEGWKIAKVSSHRNPILYKPCKRIGKDELELWPTRQVVKYSNKTKNNHITLHDLNDNEEIHNANIKAQVLFYLNHEEEINNQHI